MEDEGNTESVTFDLQYPVKLLKWKVKSGNRISLGTILLFYEIKNQENTAKSILKMKSKVEGTVHKLLVKEGEDLHPGTQILLFETGACAHSVVMKDLCAECGADLRQLDSNQTSQTTTNASVSMIHSIPELRISEDQAKILGKADQERLLKARKLVLLVDLDQTLIHTTNEDVPPDMKDIFHFQLYGIRSPWYHTKFRPGTEEFLEKISKLYELHIFTFGARPYAHHIACLIDYQGKYFSHRILSRDECFSQSTKCANLKALFPCGDSMVCIIDDREDVWNFAPNMVPVKPYHFFTGTGDINAPLGIDRMEYKMNSSKQRKKIAVPDSGTHKNKKTGLQKIKASENKAGTTDNKIIATDNKFTNTNDETVVAPEKENNEKPNSNESQPSLLAETNSIVETEINNSASTVDNKPQTANPGDGTSSSDSTSSVEIAVNKEEDSKQDDTVVNMEVEREVNVNGETPDLIEKTTNESVTDNASESEEITTDNLSQESIKDFDDDYLVYLEEILAMIHKAFYDLYDQMKTNNKTDIPDLKLVIPYVRRKVLQNLNIVFSGVIPTNIEPEKSKVWMLAKSLGANVTKDLVPHTPEKTGTTHLIAAKLGTVKVIKAKKMKGVWVVNPDWLWCCSERWERVEERIFPLTEEISKNPFAKLKRKHLFGSQNYEVPKNEPSRIVDSSSLIDPPVSEKQDEDHLKFSGSYSPLLSFSTDEITKMGQEVDDACSEESENEANEEELGNTLKVDLESESTSGESLSGGELPKGWKKRKKMEVVEPEMEDVSLKKDEFGGILDSEDEEVSSKFARTEIPYNSEKSDNSDSDDFNESIGSVDEEMAAAVEREFLN